MEQQEIATALHRVETVLRRRPATGLQDDSPALARWDSGLRVVTSHANGTQILTDMPGELGGGGDQVTPGWLMRAGLAGCTATIIAMAAAVEGIPLQSLELLASSHSDTRGVLGMTDADGNVVRAEPHDVQLLIRICAPGVAPERLRDLVENCQRRSAVLSALREEVPVSVQIEVRPA